jgi:uncharacterized membrane protein YdjX (TVP38/TMEM64 family)
LRNTPRQWRDVRSQVLNVEPPKFSSTPPRVGGARRGARIVLALTLLCAGVIALRWLKNSGTIEQVLAWLNGLGPWAPAMFIALYVVWVVALGPASLPTLGAGILFGFTLGGVYVLTAAMTVAVICFIISRHFGREWVAGKLTRHPAFRALDDAVARDGWKIVALVRLAPVFPFAISNYAFGLTRVPLWEYVLASLTMIPGTMMYVYFGTLIGDVSGIRKGAPIPVAVKIGIAIAAVLVSTYIARFVRRALKAPSPRDAARGQTLGQ